MASLFFSLSLLSLLLSLPSSLSYSFSLWPKPTSLSWPAPHLFTPLSPSFSIHPPFFPSHKPLSHSISRYSCLFRSESHHPLTPPPPFSLLSSPPLLSLYISVSSLSSPLQSGTDESYRLTISSPNATLTAQTAWGIMRGLETFSQLIINNNQNNKIIPNELQIFDEPLFMHRGLLLDTSRNFYPVKDILRTVRAMSYNKMNVFHWHITDSQSFPVVLPSEPGLGLNGSYGPGKRYSTRDVKRVVRYALNRGVRVVPEIDMPGHTGSWAEAYPDIVTCANMFWAPTDKPALAAEPGTGQLNPLKPKTYTVVKNVLSDISSLFPDKFLHAGSDEVNTACWETDNEINEFIKAGGTHDELLEIFINVTNPYIVDTLNRTVVYWEDVLLGPTVKVRPTTLPTETTVLQTWNNGPLNTKRIVQSGYKVIVSSYDFYYLDCGHGGWVGNDGRYDRQVADLPDQPFNYPGGNGGSWCAPFKSWQRVYDYDILHGLNETEARLVLGGEVALWSEQSDQIVMDGRLWPRACAMAETLWSGNRDENGAKRFGEATDRLNEWRYRMVGRGIRAEPIQPLWCPLHPTMCDLAQ